MNRKFGFAAAFQSRHLNNLVIAVVILGMLAVIAVMIQTMIFERQDRSSLQPLPDDPVTPTAADANSPSEPAALPPFTDEVRRQLQASTGFQYLVSYTDRGFEPAEFNVALGETVRFTNNSSGALHLILTDEAGQSLVPAGCDESVECHLIGRGEFWEMTFETVGTASFVNGTQRGEAGIVHINAK